MDKYTKEEQAIIKQYFGDEKVLKVLRKVMYQSTTDGDALGAVSNWVSAVDIALPADEYKTQILARRYAIDTVSATTKVLHDMAHANDEKKKIDEKIK